MKLKKKFYKVEVHGGKYIVPNKSAKKITSTTPIVTDTLHAFLTENSNFDAKKIVVTVES